MLGSIFKRKRQGETVTVLPDVAPEYRDLAKEVIGAGRYLVFASAADGRAALLLSTTPRLVASVVRKAGDSGGSVMTVEWVREASADHRDLLTVGKVELSCVGTPS